MSEHLICQCAHGDVLDDEGKPVSPCPGGHSPDPCSRDADRRLVSTTGPGRPEGQVHLCGACAEAWLAEGEWVEPGSWQDRYLALVPEKLMAADARTLIELIEEDAKRFVEALEELAALSEEECG